MNLRAILHLNGKLQEAEANYLRALQLKPDDLITQSNLHKLWNVMHKQGVRGSGSWPCIMCWPLQMQAVGSKSLKLVLLWCGQCWWCGSRISTTGFRAEAVSLGLWVWQIENCGCDYWVWTDPLRLEDVHITPWWPREDQWRCQYFQEPPLWMAHSWRKWVSGLCEWFWRICRMVIIIIGQFCCLLQ